MRGEWLWAHRLRCWFKSQCEERRMKRVGMQKGAEETQQAPVLQGGCLPQGSGVSPPHSSLRLILQDSGFLHWPHAGNPGARPGIQGPAAGDCGKRTGEHQGWQPTTTPWVSIMCPEGVSAILAVLILGAWHIVESMTHRVRCHSHPQSEEDPKS